MPVRGTDFFTFLLDPLSFGVGFELSSMLSLLLDKDRECAHDAHRAFSLDNRIRPLTD